MLVLVKLVFQPNNNDIKAKLQMWEKAAEA